MWRHRTISRRWEGVKIPKMIWGTRKIHDKKHADAMKKTADKMEPQLERSERSEHIFFTIHKKCALVQTWFLSNYSTDLYQISKTTRPRRVSRRDVAGIFNFDLRSRSNLIMLYEENRRGHFSSTKITVPKFMWGKNTNLITFSMFLIKIIEFVNKKKVRATFFASDTVFSRTQQLRDLFIFRNC